MTVGSSDEFLIPEDTPFYDIDNHIVKFPDFTTGDWIELGSGMFCSARMEGLGSPELRTNEIELSGRDGIYFGREYFGQRKWTITGAIKTGAIQNAPGTPEEAWNGLAQLLRAWDYNPVRSSARKVIPLLWKRPGRDTVLIYGRPERIDPDVTVAHSGYITYSAIFRQSDPKFYSAEEFAVGASLIAPYSGGLLYSATGAGLFAVDGRMQTTLPSEERVIAHVSGDIETSPVIIFHGPVLNPSVRLIDQYGEVAWEVGVQAAIDYTQSITVDTRHWRQTVSRSDGVNMAGHLRSSRLSEITLPLGSNELVYTGQDATNTSMCEIRYRNAWASV